MYKKNIQKEIYQYVHDLWEILEQFHKNLKSLNKSKMKWLNFLFEFIH